MGSYLINFSVYTLAMVGLILLAMFVFKKFGAGSFSSTKTGFLKVEEAMNLSARKTLYVVRAGEEKFLIAADIDKTTLISKLSDKTLLEGVSQVRESKDDLSEVLDFPFSAEKKQPVLKELARKLRA